MRPASCSTLIRLFFVATVVALLVVASLSSVMAQPRTVLGWQFEHFLGYFVATFIVCIAISRTWAVAGAMVAAAEVG